MKSISISRLVCCLVAIAAICISAPQRSSAALLIDLQNGLIGPVLNPGDTLTLDVFLSSDVADDLEAMTFFLDITAGGANLDTAGLEFVDPQNEDYLLSPEYVFFDNSDAVGSGLPATTVDTINENNDSLGVDDLAADFVGTSIDAIPVLIARYEVEALASATAGDTFTISLDEAFSDFLTTDGSGDDFTSNSLTVIIGSPVAVPEPSSLAALAVISAPILMRRKRQLS